MCFMKNIVPPPFEEERATRGGIPYRRKQGPEVEQHTTLGRGTTFHSQTRPIRGNQQNVFVVYDQ